MLKHTPTPVDHTTKRRPRVAVFTHYFPPAAKAGGPIKSLSNLTKSLGGRLSFLVLTSSHDLGGEPLLNVAEGAPVRCMNAIVIYRKGSLWDSVLSTRDAAAFSDDVVYFNSYFSIPHSFIPRFLLRLLSGHRLILAPRGEFSPGALTQKSLRKRVYIAASNLMGLHRNVTFHASTQMEASEIQRAIRCPESQIVIAGNVVSPIVSSERRAEKIAGGVRLVFVSRVHRKKGLEIALRALRLCSSHVQFDIYGPIEDRRYFQDCMDIVGTLASHIQVNYRGILSASAVNSSLTAYDAFLMPTRGENFGHAIFEALQAGLPVLISDQTPWRGLERSNAGYDLPLGATRQLAEAIDHLASLEEAQFAKWRAGARRRADEWTRTSDAESGHWRLFNGHGDDDDISTCTK